MASRASAGQTLIGIANKFSQLSPELVDELNNSFSVRKISNPLVVIVGIDYKKQGLKEHKSIIGKVLDDNHVQTKQSICRDFANILYAFHYMLKYSVMYQSIRSNGESRLMHIGLTTKIMSKRDINSEKTKLKTNWTYDEFDEFNIQVRKKLSTKCKYNYDGLIYFLTCHGGQENAIYFSDGEEDNLAFLFDRFDNENCRHLRNKPKIFFINCARGDKTDVLTLPPTIAQKVSLKYVEKQHRPVRYARRMKEKDERRKMKDEDSDSSSDSDDDDGDDDKPSCITTTRSATALSSKHRGGGDGYGCRYSNTYTHEIWKNRQYEKRNRNRNRYDEMDALLGLQMREVVGYDAPSMSMSQEDEALMSSFDMHEQMRIGMRMVRYGRRAHGYHGYVYNYDEYESQGARGFYNNYNNYVLGNTRQENERLRKIFAKTRKMIEKKEMKDPRNRHRKKYAAQDVKEVELKSQYWNDMTYRKESHFRYIYSTPEGYMNNQLIIDHSKGSPLIRAVTKVVVSMFEKSKDEEKKFEKQQKTQSPTQPTTQPITQSATQSLTQSNTARQGQSQALFENKNDDVKDGKTERKKCEFLGVGIEFENFVNNVRKLIDKSVYKNELLERIDATIEKEKKLDIEKQKERDIKEREIVQAKKEKLEKAKKEREEKKKRGDKVKKRTFEEKYGKYCENEWFDNVGNDYNVNIEYDVRKALYSPIIEDNNRMPYFIRLVPRTLETSVPSTSKLSTCTE